MGNTYKLQQHKTKNKLFRAALAQIKIHSSCKRLESLHHIFDRDFTSWFKELLIFTLHLLFPISIWTFILLFYLEFSFSIRVSIRVSKFLFVSFSHQSWSHFGFLPNLFGSDLPFIHRLSEKVNERPLKGVTKILNVKPFELKPCLG